MKQEKGLAVKSNNRIDIISDKHFTATPTGLIIEGKPSVESWLEYGEKIKQIHGAIQWICGDWLNYGEKAYGQKYSQALDETGYSYDTLRHVSWVAAKVEPCRRKHNLSWSHHLEVIKLNPDEQDFWLAKAEEENLSTKQLRGAIIKHRQGKMLEDAAIQKEIHPLIWQEDYNTWLDKMPECDLLLTAPPNSREIKNVPEFVDKWFFKALAKVKNTGHAFILIGASSEELKFYLNARIPDSLTLEQVLIWTHKSMVDIDSKRAYRANYMPVLYLKGKKSADLYFSNITEQEALQSAKEGTELARRFISHSTREGNIILDPFAGRGAFIVAAGSLGRKAYGCEMNESILEIALHSGCQQGDYNLIDVRDTGEAEMEEEEEIQQVQTEKDSRQKDFEKELEKSKQHSLWAQMQHKINFASVKACGFSSNDLKESGIPLCFWRKNGVPLDSWCRENRHLIGIYDDTDRTDLTERFIESLIAERRGEIVTPDQQEAHMDARYALAEEGSN